VWRVVKSAISQALGALRAAWQIAFPVPPDEPDGPPTVVRAAALREAALLSEDVDAISKKHIA